MMVTREQAKAIRERAEKALTAEFGEDAITKGSINYGAGGVTFKCEIVPGDTADEREQSIQTKWDACARAYGLKPEHLGQTFRTNGVIYKIIDIDPKARKQPIIVQTDEGQRLKVSAAATLAYLSVPKPVTAVSPLVLNTSTLSPLVDPNKALAPVEALNAHLSDTFNPPWAKPPGISDADDTGSW